MESFLALYKYRKVALSVWCQRMALSSLFPSHITCFYQKPLATTYLRTWFLFTWLPLSCSAEAGNQEKKQGLENVILKSAVCSMLL